MKRQELMQNGKDKLIERHNLNLGTYYFFEGYFIAEVKEGEVITLEKLNDLIPLIFKYYGNGRPFSYISNRINSHSISPIDYLNCPLNEMENFNGYGVVTYTKICETSVQVEKHFAKKPLYQFNNLEEAINWSKKSA
ncbi:hypothetical protein U6A24_03475 [Aquimarina gracilis]|uniref:STAS/SEC14 domain-containing protein n=1 Tax=Aquimarina gracilis TaxID=874422 RepID=A0ABU5ZR10_9FLAO|nr:hypothetical protein [Aquimarina gracilis]MEB3344504.1 hypothetical protein [Aquimarina gracilis]